MKSYTSLTCDMHEITKILNTKRTEFFNQDVQLLTRTRNLVVKKDGAESLGAFHPDIEEEK